MRQVLCPILVGRDEEMALLANAVAGVAAGRGGCVLVLGEAGIGKSRLVREAVPLGRDRGLAVLVGRAVDSATPAPFRPLTEALMAGVPPARPSPAHRSGPLPGGARSPCAGVARSGGGGG